MRKYCKASLVAEVLSQAELAIIVFQKSHLSSRFGREWVLSEY
jgi:hypothetical protein